MSDPIHGAGATTTATATPEPIPPPRRPRGRVATAAAIVGGVAAVAVVSAWIVGRATHSTTDDAFVEGHLVNIAPQMVSGRIIRILVDENDRVVPGQVLAEVDPIPYRDQVEEARRKLEMAEAMLLSEQALLDQVRKQVPIRIEIAKRSRDGADSDRVKAEKSAQLSHQEVDKAIDAARAGVKSARADLTLAIEEHGRYMRLYEVEAATQQRAQMVARSRSDAEAQLDAAEAKLATAIAQRLSVDAAEATAEASRTAVSKSAQDVELSKTGQDELRAEERKVEVRRREVAAAAEALRSAQHELEYTRIRAPFPGVVVKRYRNLGDFVSPGSSVLNMYDPDLIYVEANLEETRLPGVEPGNDVAIRLDAFDRPFRGRVLWINKSTGAEFALMPRNVVSGEFTKVVQRVAVRIRFEPDDRSDRLRAGLSAHVTIAHGPGDRAWAADAARALQAIEARYNLPADVDSPSATPGAAGASR